jgi:hypothetical protein
LLPLYEKAASFNWRFWGILRVLLQKRRRKWQKNDVFFDFFLSLEMRLPEKTLTLQPTKNLLPND